MKTAVKNIFQKLISSSWKVKTLLSLALVLLLTFIFCLPNPLFDVPYSYVVEDAQGELLGAVVAEDGQWRFPEDDSIPEKFAQSLITFEDKRFYYHFGIDLLAIGRAIKDNFSKSKVVSGASTLHMQVIRLSRNQDRTIYQKLIEAFLAVRLFAGYSKNEVLSLYASHAPFGGNVVGLEAASWRYFGRKPSDLTWAESATLAILPNAPSLIHPNKNRNLLLQKRNRLLEKLFHSKKIDESTYLSSITEPLPKELVPLPTLAPHLLHDFKKKNTGEYRLHSTLNASLQQQVQNILLRHHQYLSPSSIHNACALILEVKTGKVLSYVGNILTPSNKEHAMDVDIIQAKRSPGSLLKPILYAAMMSDGLITPHALIPDIPTQMSGYVPQNFDLKYDGAVPASKVVARSLNIPSVRMLRQYNYIRFHQLLKDLGISTMQQKSSHYGLSMILGGGEVTMWEIASIYASLAQQYQQLHLFSKEVNTFNKTPFSYFSTEKKSKIKSPVLLNNSSLWWMFSSMEDVMRPGEENFWQQFISSRRIAWKTGTSFGFRDAWALGITPEYIVAVWVGNANGEGRPSLVGIRTAAPILFDIFDKLPSTTWFEKPQHGISTVEICQKSGYKAGPLCQPIKKQSVPASSIKSDLCPYHQEVYLDKNGFRVHDQCTSPSEMHKVGWFTLPPSIEYFYRQVHFDYQPVPEYRSDCISTPSVSEMEIIYPPKGAKISVPKDLSGEYESAIFQVAHRRKNATVYWNLDQEFIGTTKTTHKLPFHPATGKHTLTVVDDQGERKQVQFEVK